MTEQMKKHLTVPTGRIDVVLDTDTYNEIDDQFAVSYLLRSKEKLNTVALYAAPFLNERSESAADGMEKSYNEIHKLLAFLQESVPVYRGSTAFLSDEETPVVSDAARDLCARAKEYTEESPLYVVAIGAITNVASALLLDPTIAKSIVVVWLGGHAHHYPHTHEFNMLQDVAAARVVMRADLPFIQAPCMGVVDRFALSYAEMQYFLKGKNSLADFLVTNAEEIVKGYVTDDFWSRVIWDVVPIAWLLNDGGRFMADRLSDTYLPDYDRHYEKTPLPKPMTYIYDIAKDALFRDLAKKLTENA